jgi:hypothetical protein
LAGVLLRPGQIAEGTPRRGTSFVGRHAAFDVVGGHQIEMGLHLVGELVFKALLKMQCTANL